MRCANIDVLNQCEANGKGRPFTLKFTLFIPQCPQRYLIFSLVFYENSENKVKGIHQRREV